MLKATITITIKVCTELVQVMIMCNHREGCEALLPKRTPMGLKFILSGDHSNLGFAPNRRFSEAIFAEDNQDKTV